MAKSKRSAAKRQQTDFGQLLASHARQTQQITYALASRIAGRSITTNPLPILIDFIAAHYGWTQQQFEKLTPYQLRDLVEAALDREAKRITPRNDPLGTETDIPSLLSASDLARMIGQKPKTVETFLRRLRATRPDCFEVVESRRKNEPRYLYRVHDVRSDLRAHFTPPTAK